MNDCIFCKISNGEFDTKFIYEDDLCVAFDDLNPQAPVHTLIVPKKHVASLADEPSEEMLGHLLSVAPKVAKLKGIFDSGWRTIINTKEDAGQTVMHLHIHVLGGVKMEEGML